ncbi:MAG TPA: alpha/beta hydrolase [Bryobacteraceae bacterium]|jgi:pimeloyl-ACP methyl ester carboxylesterase
MIGNRWRRIFLAFAGLFCVAAIAGASYQAMATRADVRLFPRPGRLVTAGQLHLNLYCTGQGSPTVILESGLADSLDSWRRVQPEVARFTRVCSYDRAGYGYSDLGPMPRTADRIATELHAALQPAGEKPPFILVGHSFGGFIVRVFNGQYPDEVAGLVLVDSTQEDQYRLLPRAWADLGIAMRRRVRRQAFWAPLLIDFGITRLQLQMQGLRVPTVLLQTKYLKARSSEFQNIEVSAEQARSAGHLENKPLLVLTAAKVIDASLKAALSDQDQRNYQQTWISELQPRLARLSTQGRRIIVPDSGHDMPADRPDAIVAAVRELSR